MEDEKSEKPMIKFIGFFYLCAMRVAFTGHRNYSETTNNKLREVIQGLIAEGYTAYLCGMAEGFDIAAAEVVLALKELSPQLELHCVIPFKGHISKMPSTEWAERYARILSQADSIITLAEQYDATVYHQRNDYLVQSADCLICYYSGRVRSGTGYTVRRAMKKGIRVANLYADSYQIQFFG